MLYILIILVIALIIELKFHPRLDRNVYGDFILWYDYKKGRKFLIIK
jgi:hypothetical protein